MTIIDFGSEWRKARKPHECVCGKTIKPGTRYLRHVSKVDGEITVTNEAEHIHSHEEEEWAMDQRADRALAERGY
jgi:hypothetical protein